jgi:hypothetical protein
MKEFILAHSFRGFSPWLFDLIYLGRTSWWQMRLLEEEAVHLMVDRKQSERGGDWQSSITFKGHPPKSLLPPARSYLPMFSPPPKTAPSAGEQAFNT